MKDEQTAAAMQQKTQDQLRTELFQQIKGQGGAQHLTEVAMPGVVRPVNSENV